MVTDSSGMRTTHALGSRIGPRMPLIHYNIHCVPYSHPNPSIVLRNPHANPRHYSSYL